MKKFNFKIRGNKYNVELNNIDGNIAEIEVNGSKYEVEIEKEVKVSKTPKLIRSKIIPTGVSAKAKTSKPSDRKGTGGIKAPLPGTILEMKVKVGDEVNVGDTLLIMEAMKMENEIKADKTGKIVDVKVNAGDSVLEGENLVEIGS